MRKSFLVAFLTAIMAGGLVLVATVGFDNVQAAVNVSGTISSNTTWTKTNSPYNLKGTTTIAFGAILMIEPGVTVNLNGHCIHVDGTLRAKGSSSDSIHFVGGEIALAASYSIIEKSVLSSTSISVNGGAPEILNNTIIGASSGTGISCGGADDTIISGNLISSWTTGIATGTNDIFFASGYPLIEKK